MRTRCAIGLIVLALTGCARCGKSGQVSADGGEQGETNAGGSRDAARFSRPIAAALAGAGSVIVAGLVVPRSVIAVTRIGRDGATEWTTDAISSVAWSANAELAVYPTPDGALVVWRGLRDGKVKRESVRVSGKGELKGDPVEIGVASCVTLDALAWMERAGGGGTRLRVQPWAGGAAIDALTVPEERDPELICGAHRVFALGEGEDDVTAASYAGDASTKPVIAIRDAELRHPVTASGEPAQRSDEEREHIAYTAGDALGFVRVGVSGTLATRELDPPKRGEWQRRASKISPDDDVVAVDADAHAVFVVFTSDAGDSCGGGGAMGVRAMRGEREGDADAVFELAPPDCERDVGPFWTGSAGASFVVAWAERAHKRDATTAPISGLAFRAFSNGAFTPLARLARPSDELVDAGCDETRCYAVALVRDPGTDDMQPERVSVIAYP